ncbi:MAG: hypothetical protein ACKPGT_01550 [Microcystis sp.]|jgi:hypothetical protein|uniref:hypothetical protein n=1 Tax=Microcystis aeruginosa TaxID=1126 RepID=UPI0008FF7D83|nr:hypothetical protein [Microcystis aeruginosa]
MKTQGFERRFSQNLAPVSQEKPQNPYLAYISHLFSKPYLVGYLTRCATKNDRIRVPEDTLSLLISESLVNQD